MGEGRGIDWFISHLSSHSLPEELRRLVEEAYNKASEYGKTVGRVSRFFPVEVGSNSRVIVEVDPETYYSSIGSPIHRIGDYLVIVDLKGRLVLGRITGIRRGDLLSMIGSNMPADSSPALTDPSSLATTTLLEVEPLMEADLNLENPPVPASTSIEPQSPVIDPRPELVGRLLNLPGEGALVGALATPSELIKQGSIPVYLPFKVFLQHILVIGTTGSGKTTFLKNLAAHMYTYRTSESPVLVFVDMNQDFIQLAFEPLPLQEADDTAVLIKERLFNNVKPVDGVIVLLPITDYILADSAGKILENWCDYTVKAVEKHIEEAIKPIIEGLGYEEKPEIRKISRSDGACRIEVRIRDKQIIYIPYAINTINTPTSSITRLMPDMTLLSLDLFRRTRERYRKLHGKYPPLISIAAAIHAYLVATQKRTRSYDGEIESYLIDRLKGVVEDESILAQLIKKKLSCCDQSLVSTAGDYIELVERSRASLRTLEAIYRRINSMLDAGVLDIIYPRLSNGDIELFIAVEPEWDWIVELSISKGYPIVLDLGVLNSWGAGGVEAARLLAYRMLEKLKDWKHKLWARRSSDLMARKKIVVVIDEAHQFFPQQKGSSEEQETARQIAAMISSIARLGRARGIGLVFATHSPKDLHDIILQLSNTKIILRTEKNQLETIDLPSDIKRYIPRLPDRFMVISSYIYRDYLIAATTTPLTMHYDLSA